MVCVCVRIDDHLTRCCWSSAEVQGEKARAEKKAEEVGSIKKDSPN